MVARGIEGEKIVGGKVGKWRGNGGGPCIIPGTKELTQKRRGKRGNKAYREEKWNKRIIN